MTEQEFKKELDAVVLKGINELGASTVLGALTIVSRFTEIIYDNGIITQLNQSQQEASTEKGSTDDSK